MGSECQSVDFIMITLTAQGLVMRSSGCQPSHHWQCHWNSTYEQRAAVNQSQMKGDGWMGGCGPNVLFLKFKGALSLEPERHILGHPSDLIVVSIAEL